jgi:hypothetical protein
MKESNPDRRQEILRRIVEALVQYGETATREAATGEAATDKAAPNDAAIQSREAATQAVTDTARRWMEAGFDDPEEVADWLRARCFDARGALALERAGLTPEQAAVRTKAGTADYEETIGFKIIKGDLSLEEARRIVTSDFWNS